MQKSLQSTLIYRRPTIAPKVTNFYTLRYPDRKLFNSLHRQELPFNTNSNGLSKVVIKYLWEVASIEEYKSGALISPSSNKSKSDYDFIWVVKGFMQFKLDNLHLNGVDCAIKSTYVTIQQDEYVDVKTITDKYLKQLKNPGFRT